MLRLRVFLLSALLCSISTACLAAGAKTMSVNVPQSELRSSPSGLGSVVTPLKLGDQLTVIETKGSWVKGSFGNKVGWVPSASLVKGVLKASGGGKDAQLGVSSEESSLATKGFTKEIENKFRQDNKDMDFTWVDKMEKFKVDLADILAFMKKGKLEIKEGGAK